MARDIGYGRMKNASSSRKIKFTCLAVCEKGHNKQIEFSRFS